MIWLWLLITSFTPDHGITVREVLIPFESSEQCEVARSGIVTNQRANIGVSADSGYCVTIPNEEEFKRQTEAWPDQRSYDEKVAMERDRLSGSIAEAKRFKDEYDKVHK